MANSSHVLWQLVGQADVRRAEGRCVRTGDLIAAIGRVLCLHPKWLQVSFRAQRLSPDEHLPKECRGGDVHCLDGDPVLVSLVLPRSARPCDEARIPRTKRHRVINQTAVAALAWQPGLLLHEQPAKEDGSGKGGGCSRPASPTYAIFVSGLAGFPAPLLRLDLGCESPTVATLRKHLHEVTGADFDITFAGELLRGERKYLHRLGVLAGSVVAAQGSGRRPALTPASCADALASCAVSLGASASAIALDLDDSPATTPEGCARKRKEVEPPLLTAHTGALWSGSSRKKTLSSGNAGLRGPWGRLSLLAAAPSARMQDAAQANVLEPRPEACGGFQMPG